MRSTVSFALLFCAAVIFPAPVYPEERPLNLASLDSTEVLDKPVWGDRMKVFRPFGPWTLVCELSVSQNRRLCSVEQLLKDNRAAIYWKLAQTDDGRPVLVLSLPATMDSKSGMNIGFGNIRADVNAWNCTDKACISFLVLNKTLGTLLLTNSRAELVYTTTSGTPLKFVAELSGLQAALGAAAKDPFGKQVAIRKVATPKKVRVPLPKPRPKTPTSQEGGYAEW